MKVMKISRETTGKGTETYFGNQEPSVQDLFLLTNTLHGLNLLTEPLWSSRIHP